MLSITLSGRKSRRLGFAPASFRLQGGCLSQSSHVGKGVTDGS